MPAVRREMAVVRRESGGLRQLVEVAEGANGVSEVRLAACFAGSPREVIAIAGEGGA